MEALALVMTAAGIHLLAVMSPGPNFVVISRNALTYSRRSGMFTTIGVTCGVFILLALGFLGITALIAQSESIYHVVRLAGAAYLIVLGLRSLAEVRPSRRVVAAAGIHPFLAAGPSFRMGFTTAITNPKAVVYLLAFFTTIISVDTPVAAKLALLVLMPTITFSWYSLLVWLFSQPRLQERFIRYERWPHVLFGALLVALGVGVGFSAR